MLCVVCWVGVVGADEELCGDVALMALKAQAAIQATMGSAYGEDTKDSCVHAGAPSEDAARTDVKRSAAERVPSMPGGRPMNLRRVQST